MPEESKNLAREFLNNFQNEEYIKSKIEEFRRSKIVKTNNCSKNTNRINLY